MIKLKRIFVVMAAALLAGSVTGCSGKINTGNAKPDNGELTDKSVVIAVGDMEVKYSEALNYCYLLKRQYDGNFGKKLWKYGIGDGKKIDDEAKEEIVNMVTQIKVICHTAEKEEIALTNDEKDEALSAAEDVMSEATAGEKKKYILSVQGLSELYQENMLANKMFYIATDEADTEISDEEARQVKIQYIKVITEGTLPNGTEVHLSGQEKKTAAAKLEKLRKEAAKSGDFLDLAKKNSDSDTYELTIGSDSTDIGSEAVRAAFGLKKGKISHVIEDAGAYYLVLCLDDFDDEATYKKKEAIIEERQTKMFQQKYASWLGDNDVRISKSFWREFSLAD